MKKTLITVLVTVIVCFSVIGTTYAWLMDKTQTITNTFTAGDIKIKLEETTGSEYKMIPGITLTKDPTVTVEKNSEDCWLFVKITKSQNFDTFVTYEMADGWTEIGTGSGVYYRSVDLKDSDQEFAVIKDNKMTVIEDVTKEQLSGIGDGLELGVTAYAVQELGFENDPSGAWEKAQTLG